MIADRDELFRPPWGKIVGMEEQRRKTATFTVRGLLYLVTGMAVLFGVMRLTGQLDVDRIMGGFVLAWCVLVWVYLRRRRTLFP